MGLRAAGFRLGACIFCKEARPRREAFKKRAGLQPAFAAGRASHNGAAFKCTLPHVKCAPCGSGLDREAFDPNPQWSTGLLPRRPAIPTDAEPLAVKTAPTRQCAPIRQCTPVGAVSTAKLLIHKHDGRRLLPRRLAIATGAAPNDSRSRPLPHVKCTPRGSGLDREAFDSKRTVSAGLLPRRLAIASGAEPLAVKTAPTRQMVAGKGASC